MEFRQFAVAFKSLKTDLQFVTVTSEGVRSTPGIVRTHDGVFNVYKINFNIGSDTYLQISGKYNAILEFNKDLYVPDRTSNIYISWQAFDPRAPVIRVNAFDATVLNSPVEVNVILDARYSSSLYGGVGLTDADRYRQSIQIFTQLLGSHTHVVNNITDLLDSNNKVRVELLPDMAGITNIDMGTF